MHPLVRDLYKRAINVGRDYPHSQGLNFVRETWKKALRDPSNFDVNHERIKNDPVEYEKVLRKAVGRGRYAIREMIGVIQMKKFRTMKRRYGGFGAFPKHQERYEFTENPPQERASVEIIRICPMSKLATSDYDKFHRMVASPAIARSCINSFCESEGCILFIPSHATFQDYPMYDASNILNLPSYYALVVVSFTGLSTLLNCTKTVAIKDFVENGGVKIYPKASNDSKNKVRIEDIFCSKSNPELKLDDDILIYLQNYTWEDVNSDGKEDSLFLLRSFEYKFGLLGGLDVIMFHIASNDKKKLHLVEVYKLRNAFVNYIFSHVFHILGSLCRYIFEPKVLKKSLHKTKSN